jgi:propanol-preferring alcohol dehydrogenase
VPELPHIGGHEPAGVVVEVGRDVGNVRPGQRVVPYLFVRGADCRYTRAGRHAQATHLAGIIGVTLPGGFAEYFKAPAANVLPLPDEVPFEAGGLASCAVITAVHAWRRAELQMGDVALVLGAGGIGLIMLQILKAAGVRTVCVSRSAASLRLAEQAGAELALSLAATDTAERVRQFTGDREGADCVFEMVGMSATMSAAADYVRRCGKIVVIGEEAEFPAIDTIRIAQRELAIIGSRNGGLQDALDALEMMARGIIRPPIAARYPLAEVNQALACLRDGKAHGRIILNIRP